VKSRAKRDTALKSTLTLIETSLDDDKAENIVAIDLAGKSSIADFMVIATGRNQRQLSAMADHLVKKLKDQGLGPVPIEGAERGDWVLIDAGDVIVHLFRPEMRTHYNLEKMWDVTLPEPERLAAMGG
jgi:ribosome-associated protein